MAKIALNGAILALLALLALPPAATAATVTAAEPGRGSLPAAGDSITSTTSAESTPTDGRTPADERSETARLQAVARLADRNRVLAANGARESSEMVRAIRAAVDSAAAERDSLQLLLAGADAATAERLRAALAALDFHLRKRILEIQRDHARSRGCEALARRADVALTRLIREYVAPAIEARFVPPQNP
jgi:hypothetical protein